jgi:cell division septum initiation protein DivIVA
MPSERQRILELALESLANKKKDIEEEIASLTKELRRGRAGKGELPGKATLAPRAVAKRRKRSRFSKAERARRAARMKAYWEKWRKDKARQK